MSTNQAAYQPAKKALSMVVKPAPYPTASPNTIVVKNHAVAINPIDWLIQRKADIMYTWLKYPFVLGIDVAGEVVEVGNNVTRFQVGDRVTGLARGSDEKVNSPAEGAFQHYTVLQQDLASHIPSSMPYETACVIPLGLTTAAAALFEKDQLNLQLPATSTPSTKVLIIWGGSTSVGCNAIQLGVAAGCEVFATASPSNFELCKKLGASRVFDYKSKSIVQDIVSAFKGKRAAGALTIGDGGAEACMEILSKVEGNKFIAMASFPVLKEEPKNLALLRTAYYFVSWIASFKVKGLLKGVRSNFLIGSSIGYNSIGKAIWADFLPSALENGTFVAAPRSFVFGKGLESIQGACDYQSKGVSATKVVVSL
jgi:NADPH:quinone reductase-like Zn-dependent oxidoreductase